MTCHLTCAVWCCACCHPAATQSNQVASVERFLVVHGQILLSQLKNYPTKDVQRSPFVSSLKERMEARKHSKLYYSKRGFSKAPRAINRNPMKVRGIAGDGCVLGGAVVMEVPLVKEA